MTTARKPSMPSIKTLSVAFPDNAKAAREVLLMNRDQLEAHLVGAARIKECYLPPMTWDLRMFILNAVGEFHGVESLVGTRGEWAKYLNAGDCYVPTLIFWHRRFRVQSLGDFIETVERQGVKFK